MFTNYKPFISNLWDSILDWYLKTADTWLYCRLSLFIYLSDIKVLKFATKKVKYIKNLLALLPGFLGFHSRGGKNRTIGLIGNSPLYTNTYIDLSYFVGLLPLVCQSVRMSVRQNRLVVGVLSAKETITSKSCKSWQPKKNRKRFVVRQSTCPSECMCVGVFVRMSVSLRKG